MNVGTKEDARAAIQAGNLRFGEGFRKGDPGALAALYTEGGQVLAPHAPAVSGREGIQGLFASVLAMGLDDAVLETDELEVLGGTAIEIGRYRLMAGAGQVVDQGKYLVVWKLDQGEWKLHRDIWNSSLEVGAL